MIHTILFYTIHSRVHITARTVEISCMHMNDKRLAAHTFSMYTSRICQPVVGMYDIIVLLACYHTGHYRIVVYLVVKVLRITAREFYAPQVICQTITEIRVNMITQFIILLRRHPVAKPLFYIVIIDIFPDYGSLTHAYDVHETLIFIPPRLGQAECDMHIRLFGQAGSDTVAGCS